MTLHHNTFHQRWAYKNTTRYKIIYPLKKSRALHWTNWNFPCPIFFCAVWLKCIFAISLPSILGKEHGLSFEQTWILSVLAFPDGCPWKRKGPSFEQTWIPFIQRKFWNFVNVFSLFHNYSPFRRGHGRLFKKKLNPLHPRMICANFGWNWPGGSGEENFEISSMYFRYFIIIPPPWKGAWPFI